MLDRLRIVYKDDGIQEQVKAFIPDGNLIACLTCGTCASGCPATGLHNMDPRKFIRMAVFGMDKELERHPWGTGLPMIWSITTRPITTPCICGP